MSIQDRASAALDCAVCPADGNGHGTDGELAAGEPNPPVTDRTQEADCTLILWAVARGVRPAAGWFRTVGLSEKQVAALARQHSQEVARLKLLLAAGELLGSDELMVLLRARLAEALIEARSPKELSEVARILEKLPAADSPAETEEEELSLEDAIAEARRLLAELDSDPYDRHPALKKPQAGPDWAAK